VLIRGSPGRFTAIVTQLSLSCHSAYPGDQATLCLSESACRHGAHQTQKSLAGRLTGLDGRAGNGRQGRHRASPRPNLGKRAVGSSLEVVECPYGAGVLEDCFVQTVAGRRDPGVDVRLVRDVQRHFGVVHGPVPQGHRGVAGQGVRRDLRSTLHQDLDELLLRLNRTLRGWANYFRHGVSKKVFNALGYHAWRRIGRWLRRKRGRISWSQVR
jgi:hypothetical protein